MSLELWWATSPRGLEHPPEPEPDPTIPDHARRIGRAAFVGLWTALSDPHHPLWDALLFGRSYRDSRGHERHEGGIVPELGRHPLGHGCDYCRQVRRANPWWAQIEADLLDRRPRRRPRRWDDAA